MSQILEERGSLISYYWQLWHSGFFCVHCEDFLLVCSIRSFITSFLEKELLSGGFPDQVGNWESPVSSTMPASAWPWATQGKCQTLLENVLPILTVILEFKYKTGTLKEE